MRVIVISLALTLVSACGEARSGVGSNNNPRSVSNTASDSNNPPSTSLTSSTPNSTAASTTLSAAFTEAEFASHVDQLKKKLPSKEFSVFVQPPFVVIGDEGPSEIKERAEGTVKRTVERLKLDFFSKDPKEILDIWLFKDKASYEKHTKQLFGETPTTPYGYYSSTHKALIMNISTGSGTLVHEIVHPFIEANFPACPAWFNEGLSSLYEQSGEEDGHIHGYTNWRLPGLQRAIREGKVPSFKTLASMSSDEFYNEDRGTNYGQARYLCYYLQQKGLLVKFYREFHSNQKKDPTGFQSLQKVLGEADMDAFKKKWEKYVLGLRVGYEVTIN
jgi:hypothetical protein